MELTRNHAEALLHEYTLSPSLRRHALSVEAAMSWYARHYQLSETDQLKWKICGLLHDFDYEKYPTADPVNGHPFMGNQILKALGYPEDICEAIMGHANYSGVPRVSLMAKTLYAVDELSGLIVASTLVLPDKKIAGLELSSVMKKFKSKSFAQGVNRQDIVEGAQSLNLELEVHVQNTLLALKEQAAILEL